jgi:glyoxylase I family protein
MAMIKLDHISLIVTDTQIALGFYQGFLELEIDLQRPDLPFPGAWLKAGEQAIHLLELPNPDPTTNRPAHGGRDRHLAFRVSDLNHYQQYLVEHRMDYSLSMSGRRALFCRDPDGNACELIEV